MPSDDVEDELRRIGRHIADDMDSLISVACVMMTEPLDRSEEPDVSDGESDVCNITTEMPRTFSDSQASNYSESLCSFVRSLPRRHQVLKARQSPGLRDYYGMMSDLRAKAATHLARLEAEHKSLIPPPWQQQPVRCSPTLYNSMTELTSSSDLPPGPWRVASVNPKTMQVLSISIREYEAYEGTFGGLEY